MSKTLFDDFSEVSSKEWKQKIQADLKGVNYQTLIWHTNEGIDVKPFYHADDFETLPELSDSRATEFQICQSIFVTHTEKSNVHAKAAIAKGAEIIEFIIPSETTVMAELLQGIELASTPILLRLQFLSTKYIETIPSESYITIQTDIIGHLARTGNWYYNLKEDHQHAEAIVKRTNTISIDVALYQNAGATSVQQLAYALAQANEYFNHFTTILTENEKQSFKVIYNCAVGTNYFFEIAKLRSLRELHATLAADYKFNIECQIHIIPTKRNKTIYDYNTNLLRTTTECMSAILGGANVITNLPYDAIYHKTNDFSERIANNQLLILKHESYFDKVNNPSDGAYYIESITTQLGEKALILFKDIEKNGGYLSQLKEGTIQKKIKESAAKEQDQFDNEELVLLGTNKHPNKNDRMKDELELYPFVKHNPIKTLIEPIIEKRLSETIEQNRLKNE